MALMRMRKDQQALTQVSSRINSERYHLWPKEIKITLETQPQNLLNPSIHFQVPLHSSGAFF